MTSEAGAFETLCAELVGSHRHLADRDVESDRFRAVLTSARNLIDSSCKGSDD